MRPSPPLRFLVLVGGGWIGARAAILSPLWPAEGALSSPVETPQNEMPVSAALEHHAAAELEADTQAPAGIRAPTFRFASARVQTVPLAPFPGHSRLRPRKVGREMSELPWEMAAAPPSLHATSAVGSMLARSVAPPLLQASPKPGRWSGSAWLFARQGGVAQLAAGGTLGGSQAGARLLYRINEDAERPLSLSARAYSPLESKGAEIALGIEWQPAASVPVRLLAERRQSITKGGRSAFSVLAHGGLYEHRIAGPLLLDAYAQAGIVGFRSGDLFADGSAQLSVPLGWNGRLKAGGGIWGAAQPGISRLDAGPHASLRIPLGKAAVRVSADWRFRLAGEAAPSSGPALTLATEF